MVEKVVRTQVAVVGAGPVGLMLAAELRLGGADVVVLERLAQPTTESRASTLHARTMEILDSRDLLAHVAQAPNDITGHFGGIPLDFTLPSPYPGQWKVPQTDTEAFLAQRAAWLGADIRRGHDVRALRQDDGQAEVCATGPGGTVRVRADYVVGCDGEHSTVRGLAPPMAAPARTPGGSCCAGTSTASRSPTGASSGSPVAWPSPPGEATA